MLGAAAWSVVSNIVDIEPRWQTPLVFLGLYAVLRSIDDLKQDEPTNRYEPIHGDADFYPIMERAISETRSNISLSYVRTGPPTSFHSADLNNWMQRVEDWARRNPNRRVRRIIGTSGSPAMDAWIVEHHTRTKGLPNYAARVVPWPSPFDSINVAMFDDTRLVLVVTVEGQEVRGLSLDDPTARDFGEYYSFVWASGEPLGSYVARIDHSSEQ